MAWFKITFIAREVKEAYIQAYSVYDLINKITYIPECPSNADQIYSIVACAEPTETPPHKIY
jgi:hypothetical protein